jgi:hypothetical protein
MKNDLSNSSRNTYFSGWDVALHNYNVFEVESIKLLVNSSNNIIQPQLVGDSEQSTDYFPLTVMNSHQLNF